MKMYILALVALIQLCVVLAKSGNGNGNGNGNRNGHQKWDKSNEEGNLAESGNGNGNGDGNRNGHQKWDKSNEEENKWNDINPTDGVAFTNSSKTFLNTLPPVQLPSAAPPPVEQPSAAPSPVEHTTIEVESPQAEPPSAEEAPEEWDKRNDDNSREEVDSFHNNLPPAQPPPIQHPNIAQSPTEPTRVEPTLVEQTQILQPHVAQSNAATLKAVVPAPVEQSTVQPLSGQPHVVKQTPVKPSPVKVLSVERFLGSSSTTLISASEQKEQLLVQENLIKNSPDELHSVKKEEIGVQLAKLDSSLLELADQSPIDKPPIVKPAAEQSPVDRPPVDKPAAQQSPVDKPAAQQSPVDKPAAQQSPVDKSAAQQSPIDKPAKVGANVPSLGSATIQSSPDNDSAPDSVIWIVVGSILGIVALVFGILIFKRLKSKKTVSVCSDSTTLSVCSDSATLSVYSDATIYIDPNPREDFLRRLERSPSPKNQLSEGSVRMSYFPSNYPESRSSLNSEIYREIKLDE